MPPRWLLPLACFGTLAVACDGLERRSAFYETYDFAQKSGAMTRGWLPGWLPADAIHIREIHDLDTNQVCFRFELPRDTRSRFLAGLEPLGPAEASQMPKCRLRPPWWLSRGEPAQVYRAPDPSWGYIAAAGQGVRVYAWSR